jgi:hypothetical protein
LPEAVAASYVVSSKKRAVITSRCFPVVLAAESALGCFLFSARQDLAALVSRRCLILQVRGPAIGGSGG